MIPELFFWIATQFFNIIAGVTKLINATIPSWLNTGIADAMNGFNFFNAILPIYAHPEMTGIASQTGLLPMFGWAIILLILIFWLKLIVMGIRLLLRAMPWNTQL